MTSPFFPKGQGAENRGQGHGEDHADGAGNGADGLQADVGGAEQLSGLQTQRADIYDQGQAAAGNGQNQGVGHGAYHVPADVHAAAQQLPGGEAVIDPAQLLHRGGDAHGHVHDGAQSADNDAGRQKPGDADGAFPCLPQLQQRFRVLLPVAVNPQKALGSQGKERCQGNPCQRSQAGADGFLFHAPQNHEGHDAHQHRNQKGGGDGGPALQQQRQQNPDQSRRRQTQAKQTPGSQLSAHRDGHQQEQRQDHRQTRGAAVFIHVAPHGAVGVGGQAHGDPVSRRQGLAEQGADGVVRQHPGAGVPAGLYGDGEHLGAPEMVLGHGVFLGGVGKNLIHHRALIFHEFLRLHRLGFLGRMPRQIQQHPCQQSRRQHPGG